MFKNKVTIIGAGMVGSTTAFSLISARLVEELALIDINKELNRSQVMDLQHSIPFLGYTKVKIGSYNDLNDSRLVIITCGVSQKNGETRLDLLKRNSVIIKKLLPEIFRRNPKIIVIIVTNPVDILTNLAVKMFPRHKAQIFGSGTILDSARFRFLLGEKISVNPNSLHAYIIGEHGDSEVPLWSTVTVGNTRLDKFWQLSSREKDIIFNNARNAAYAIIAGKRATYYAIAAGVAQLAEAVLYNKKTVFTVSHPVDGKFGLKDVSLSLPVVIGGKGVLRGINIEVSAGERKLLLRSAKQLKQAEKGLK